MQHFINVNQCSPDIDFHLVMTKALRELNELQVMSSAEKISELLDKPVRFTVSLDIPFAEEMIERIEKKGLLYHPAIKNETV
jgi:hypothetical protein